MSWLARSFANSLQLDDHESGEYSDHQDLRTSTSNRPESPSSSSLHHEQEEEDEHSKGVKEDLSELKETLSRQLWGVASFLAPPPPTTPSCSHAVRSEDCEWNRCEPADQSVSEDEREASDSVGGYGAQNNLSDLRVNEASEVSEMASNMLSGSMKDEEDEGSEVEEFELENAVGVTEEVLAFARNIAMHPETWLDFPIDEEDDPDEFNMSDTQQEHALVVEYLAPRLAALRIELCPCHMSEGYFWKVYFVLLHSRLNKHDAELLLTAQVMAAKTLWMQELQKKTKEEQEMSRRDTSYWQPGAYDDFPSSPYYEETPRSTFSGTIDFIVEKHPITVTEMEFVDKSVIEEKSVITINDNHISTGQSSNLLEKDHENDEASDEDDWLKDENMEFGGYSGNFTMGDEEDVSFSDLEADDDDIFVPVKSKNLGGTFNYDINSPKSK